ncbi:hypothetical protein EMPG_12396 [Blastomyces silverae]|uniref:Uncharacterized protein n=1 Tax=Blastomyces silverae TaxID=2060906 RepID=A0A0H1BN71_9EURO|nr:hypothetical protein EMPG_12396 [Blastomyces silverae]
MGLSPNRETPGRHQQADQHAMNLDKRLVPLASLLNGGNWRKLGPQLTVPKAASKKDKIFDGSDSILVGPNADTSPVARFCLAEAEAPSAAEWAGQGSGCQANSPIRLMPRARPMVQSSETLISIIIVESHPIPCRQ